MRRHSSAQKRPVSEAKSFAIPASMSLRSPASLSRAARWVSRRAAEALVLAGVLGRAGLFLGDEAREAAVLGLGARVGSYEHEDQAGPEAVGHPHLGAIDLVRAVVLFARARLDRGDIGTELGLG